MNDSSFITIASWNVNSVRVRLPILKTLIEQHNPDIVLLQETKCSEVNFPHEFFSEYGYNLALIGQKSYNGVAIASRFPLEDIQVHYLNANNAHLEAEARYIEAFVCYGRYGVRLASVYVPNGTSLDSPRFPYKLGYLAALQERLELLAREDSRVVIGGDFNVAPENIDVYNPKRLDGTIGFHPLERAAHKRILASGMIDVFRHLHPERSEFSWCDYRSSRGLIEDYGMRLDQLLITPSLEPELIDATICRDFRRMERPSDHVPVLCYLRK